MLKLLTGREGSFLKAISEWYVQVLQRLLERPELVSNIIKESIRGGPRLLTFGICKVHPDARLQGLLALIIAARSRKGFQPW